MTNFARTSKGSLRSGLASGGDVHDRVYGCLEVAAAKEPELQSFCELRADGALADAKKLDQMPAADHGALHGLPFAAKEIFDVEGLLCQWGSKVHEGRRARQDCPVVQRLREAGAVLLGITTSTEYAMSTAPNTTNPYDPTRTPGASSSGSAAAVGAGIVPVALGSQTIGSCIRPAAYCGVFGFKPTIGTISLESVMPLSKTLDHCALLANSMEVIEEVFGVLRDGDRQEDAPENRSSKSVSVTVIPAWFDEPISDSVEAGIEETARLFESEGCAVERRSISRLVEGEEGCLMTILSYEMAQAHQDDRRSHGDLMSDRIRGLIDRGLGTSETTYQSALQKRRDMISTIGDQLPDGGVVLTYSTLDVAPLRTQGTGSRAPQRLWTLLGFPAISIPIGFAHGLPIAVQLIARAGEDLALLKTAKQLVARPQAD